jgi:hypothetical protein
MLRLFDGADDNSPGLQGDVQALQTALNQFYGIKVDGVFGSETEAAVRQFQLDHNLYVDGIVGPATWAALLGQEPPNPATVLPTTISATNNSMLAQFTEAGKYQTSIESAGRASNLEPAIIAGVGSRESGWGLLLKPAGPGGTGDAAPRKFPTAFRTGALPPDGGFGRGLMQIDFDAFEFARTGNWADPLANISFGCKVLTDNIALLQRKTDLTGRPLLQAAIAAYNCGAGNVLQAIRDGRDIDFYTAHRNYSADVFDRAGFFQARGWV